MSLTLEQRVLVFYATCPEQSMSVRELARKFSCEPADMFKCVVKLLKTDILEDHGLRYSAGIALLEELG